MELPRRTRVAIESAAGYSGDPPRIARAGAAGTSEARSGVYPTFHSRTVGAVTGRWTVSMRVVQSGSPSRAVEGWSAPLFGVVKYVRSAMAGVRGKSDRDGRAH